MLDFKPLTIEDRCLFDNYLKPYTFSTCEYSFTTLFIWRIGCDVKYTIYKDALIIKKTDFDGNHHFMQPIGYKKEDLKDIIHTLKEYKEKYNMPYLFKDLEESFVNEIKEILGEELELEEDRDNFDYVYDSEALINLSGKKYHGKKNHYNNFIKNNNYKLVPITDDNVKDCLKASKQWCDENGCHGYLLYELHAIKELLKHKDELNLKAMAVYVDDKVSSFTIGEKINDDTAIIQIEKADPKINGLYTFINRSFLQEYFTDVKYVNREQDLGIEGLRKAKNSYYPIKLEKKYKLK